MILLLAAGYIWGLTFARLVDDWSSDEAYFYGWGVVPALVWLLYRRLRLCGVELGEGAPHEERFEEEWAFYAAVLGGTLFVILARWLEVPNPDWRLVSWFYAIGALTWTWGVAGLLLGHAFLKRIGGLPFLFLVGLPWPSVIEVPLIQWLSRSVASVSSELLMWLGVSSVARGNIVVLDSGGLGVEEACSGIRSLQVSVALALFFGELYQLRWVSRIVYVGYAACLAVIFDILRTVVLGYAAAPAGLSTVVVLHDSVGVAVLVSEFLLLWLTGVWLRGRLEKRRQAIRSGPLAEGGLFVLKSLLGEAGRRIGPRAFVPVSVALALAVFSECMVRVWFIDRTDVPPTILGLKDNGATFGFVSNPIPEKVLAKLKPFEAKSFWGSRGSITYRFFYLRWEKNWAVSGVPQSHSPEICIPAGGHQLLEVSGPIWIDVSGVKVPFNRYLVGLPDGTFVFLYRTVAYDGLKEFGLSLSSRSFCSRIRGVLNRQLVAGCTAVYFSVEGTVDVHLADEIFTEIVSGVLGVFRQGER